MTTPEAPGRTWGVLGTANIAARAFLPALRQANGRAVAVGSRSPDRRHDWASEHGVDRVDSYAGVLEDPGIEAVYIALPNDQHAEWTIAALAAGKAVLCEKPLTMDADEASEVLGHVGASSLLWESFVFPFHPQTALLQRLIGDGTIGKLVEIVSEFHFTVAEPDNIRLSFARGGGALNDVGCYPLRLARLLTGAEPVSAIGTAATAEPGASADLDGVDIDTAAFVDFGSGVRLTLSAGLHRTPSTFTRLIGSEGELRVSNPFHPRSHDTVELHMPGAEVRRHSAAPGSAFFHAVSHIHAVLAGTVAAEHLAVDDALGQARAMDLVRASTALGRY